MADVPPILVTGAAGNIGGVGRMVVAALRGRGLPVRAFAHREDERAAALRDLGAEVVVGELTRGEDVVGALRGCRRVYFALSVSARYLEATVTMAAAARDQGGMEAFVNMSQMTVSQMSATSAGESRQHRLHWLAEQALDWSGLPVTHIRPTVFMENPLFTKLAAASIAADGSIRLPFGSGRTSPVAARDVAEVVAAVLTAPERHRERVYELTGGASRDLTAIAAELSAALGRTITYVDVPFERWRTGDLAALDYPEHVIQHIATMARLHAENRYDRSTGDVESILGRPPLSLRDFVLAGAGCLSGDRPQG